MNHRTTPHESVTPIGVSQGALVLSAALEDRSPSLRQLSAIPKRPFSKAAA
jgi:hypothetical protein